MLLEQRFLQALSTYKPVSSSFAVDYKTIFIGKILWYFISFLLCTNINGINWEGRRG